jgi:RNA polymerase sigma-70 factor (ECF subfamily)
MFYDDYLHIDTLVEKVQNKDTDALWELYDFYTPVINSCVSKLNKKYPNVDKEDLVSESIFVLKDLCQKYDKNKSYFSYFFDTRLQPYLIAKIKSKYIEKINIVSLNDSESYEPYEESDFIEQNAFIHEELEKLPPKMQQIIDLFYFKNLTQSECAVILKISQPAFNKKLHAVLDILRKNIQNEL